MLKSQNTLKLRSENTTIARAIHRKHEELMVILKKLCAEFGSRLQVRDTISKATEKFFARFFFVPCFLYN